MGQEYFLQLHNSLTHWSKILSLITILNSVELGYKNLQLENTEVRISS
jgi:hypothetical protein